LQLLATGNCGRNNEIWRNGNLIRRTCFAFQRA